MADESESPLDELNQWLADSKDYLNQHSDSANDDINKPNTASLKVQVLKLSGSVSSMASQLKNSDSPGHENSHCIAMAYLGDDIDTAMISQVLES